MDFEEEQETLRKDPSLSTIVFHQIFSDFQAASLGDQKLNIPETNGLFAS